MPSPPATAVAEVLRQLANAVEQGLDLSSGPMRVRVPVAGVVVYLSVRGGAEAEGASPGTEVRNGTPDAKPLGAALKAVLGAVTTKPQTIAQIARKLGRVDGSHIDRQVRDLCRLMLVERITGGGYVLRR